MEPIMAPTTERKGGTVMENDKEAMELMLATPASLINDFI